MKSKIEIMKNFIINENLLICPYCKKSLALLDNSLLCENKHTFNLNKKGYVRLLNNNKYVESKIYNKDLFMSRREFIKKDLYNFIYDEIAKIINEKDDGEINILDLGCGEGLHSIKILNKLKIKYKYYGFDYSKSAIELATDFNSMANFYFLSDVNNIPLKDNSIDIVLDFLSPYNEKEVKRILKNTGIFIKVVPGEKYLSELRHTFNLQDYSKNVEIFENLKKKFIYIEKKRLTSIISIDKKDLHNLIEMTPIKNKKKQGISLNVVTLDLYIYTIRN